VSPDAPGRRRELAPAVLLTALIVLATALRFWRLGDWSFEGDEIFTLRDSVNQPHLTNPRPLLFFLNHYVVRPFVPLDELSLRLLPALFGVLAIPAFYLVARRLVGIRAALFGALLLTVSAVHVHQSQYARYWSLVFLLSVVYPYALYLGFRERNGRALALGLLTGVLGVLAHPASVLLVGGVGLWLALTYLRRERFAQLWSQRSFRWATSLVGILAVAGAVRFVPVLRAWIRMHDLRLRPGDHLLGLPSGQGLKQIGLLLSYVDGLTLPVVLTGMLGFYLLWRTRDRSLALFLICMFIVPWVFILILSFRTAVGTSYILPSAPAFFIGAGVFLDRLAGMNWELRPRWLPSAAVAVIMIASGLPTLLSQYLDGRRNDFRGAARWLKEQLSPGDFVYSDQYQVMTHYLPSTEVQRLAADTAPLTESVRVLHNSGRSGVLWIVAPYSSEGGHRTNPNIGTLKGWIYANCQLRHTVGVARMDFRQNELQIYRCPPAGAEGVSSRISTTPQKKS
jgi:mannosyltransferase